jgi:hypothetical protein
MLLKILELIPFKSSLVQVTLIKIYPGDFKFVPNRPTPLERHFVAYSLTSSSSSPHGIYGGKHEFLVVECGGLNINESGSFNEVLNHYNINQFTAEAWHNLNSPTRSYRVLYTPYGPKWEERVKSVVGSIRVFISILKDVLAPKLFTPDVMEVIEAVLIRRPDGCDLNKRVGVLKLGTQRDKYEED